MNQAQAPQPSVAASFTVEPHPDPLTRALIAEIERLRRENRSLKEALYGINPG